MLQLFKIAYLIALTLIIISCQHKQQLDLEPYGLNATISCEGSCKVHAMDLIVAREITIGNDLDRLQTLILSNYEGTIEEALAKQRLGAKSEDGFERITEEKEAFFAYEYSVDGEVFTQFRQLYCKDSTLIILRAHPKHKLHKKQAKQRWQQAASFTWKE